MKYRLGLRRLTARDIGQHCPYLPEPEDYEMHLSAFVEELNGLNVVLDAITCEGDVIIELDSDSDFPVLHAEAKELCRQFSQCFANTGFRPNP